MRISLIRLERIPAFLELVINGTKFRENGLDSV